jgi:hypothetical protein
MPVSAPGGRTVELALKLGALIVVVIAILIGMQRFADGEHARVAFELRSQLFLQRLQACRTLADLSSHLVAYTEEARFPDALREFQAASRGPLVLVSDPPLDKAMLDFDLSVAEFQARRIEVRELRQRADLLIRTCECSVDRGTWKPEDGKPVLLRGACRGIAATPD